MDYSPSLILIIKYVIIYLEIIKRSEHMAKHMVKCFYCGKTFDASTIPFVKPNARRYAHKECAETASSKKDQEEKDKEELESYIKELFGISSISPKIRKQINTYRKENNYSYSGMRKTLKYFFEVRGNSVEKANGGIGIIPYVYDEAFQYWRALWEAKQKNENVDVSKYILPIKEVYILPPKRCPMKQIRKLFAFLDE